MLRILALPALGLTAVLALGTATAMAQAVKPGKGVPGAGAGVRAAPGGARGGMRAGGFGAMPRGGPGLAARPGFSGGQGAVAGNRAWRGNPGLDRRGAGVNRRGPGLGAAAIGAGVGLGLGYPYGGYETYSYPAYPGYSVGYPSELGNYCETPRRTCQLFDPAPIGADCSCRVPGGRALGEVVP